MPAWVEQEEEERVAQQPNGATANSALHHLIASDRSFNSDKKLRSLMMLDQLSWRQPNPFDEWAKRQQPY